MKLFKSWGIPLIISVGLFFAIRPVLAQTIDSPRNVTVGTVGDENGYRQIYYEFNGNKEFITNGRFTSAGPVTQGEYITWVSQINGLWQVFLYDLPAKVTTQLTFTGNNVNPKVDDKGRVVWEGWDGNAWQVYFFDGKSIAQLTSGDLSLNPEISGDYITFGRKDVSETWRAVLYSIKDKKSLDITIGEKARNPKIKDGKIYLAAGTSVEEEFPLTVDDLFLLNLVPLSATPSASPEISAPETVTTEEIIEELSASPSASPASTGTPESGSSGQ